MRRDLKKCKKNTYIIIGDGNELLAEIRGPAKPTIRLLWFRFLSAWHFDREYTETDKRLVFIKWLVSNHNFKVTRTKVDFDGKIAIW